MILKYDGQISKMLYFLLQTQLLAGDEVPAKSSGYRMKHGHYLMRGKKVKLERDQAVSDDMTETLRRKFNDLNKAVRNSCNREKSSRLKPSVNNQKMLLQKTMLSLFTKLSEI